MISSKLHTVFSVLEAEAFTRWKVASPEERKKITSELGKLEAELIIKEINEEVKKKYP